MFTGLLFLCAVLENGEMGDCDRYILGASSSYEECLFLSDTAILYSNQVDLDRLVNKFLKDHPYAVEVEYSWDCHDIGEEKL